MSTRPPTMTLDPAPGEVPRTDADPDRERRMRDISHALRVVYGSVQAYSHRIEQQCGVTPTQLWAMWELHQTPGQKVTELALSLSIHPSNCSSMADKLRKKDLVRKRRIGPDQRVVRLYLTNQGTALLATVPRPTPGVLTDALQRLPDGELANLECGLNGLLGVLRTGPDAPSEVRPFMGDRIT